MAAIANPAEITVARKAAASVAREREPPDPHSAVSVSARHEAVPAGALNSVPPWFRTLMTFCF